MACPKRKISRTRRDKRRSHLRADAFKLAVCGHCKQPKVTHRVCPHCGFYAGLEVVVKED